jgi:hypothetical protein
VTKYIPELLNGSSKITWRESQFDPYWPTWVAFRTTMPMKICSLCSLIHPQLGFLHWIQTREIICRSAVLNISYSLQFRPILSAPRSLKYLSSSPNNSSLLVPQSLPVYFRSMNLPF